MSCLKYWVDLSQIVSTAAQVVASVALLVTLALYWRLWKTAEAQLASLCETNPPERARSGGFVSQRLASCASAVFHRRQ